MLLYFLMHVVVTSLRARGIYLWVEGGVFHQPMFKFGEFLVFAAFAYHALNGVRLVLVELGFAVENRLNRSILTRRRSASSGPADRHDDAGSDSSGGGRLQFPGPGKVGGEMRETKYWNLAHGRGVVILSCSACTC